MTDNTEAKPPERSPLVSRDVIFFLIGRFLWMGAHQIDNVAVGWLIWEVTGSAWALGFVGLAAFLPRLLIVLIAGIMADRFDRRRLLAACLAVSGAANLGLVFVVLAPTVSIGWVYALFVLTSTARGFAGPAEPALLANLVTREHYSRVFGFGSSVGQSAVIIGPALGGFIYLAGAWAPFAAAMIFQFVGSVLILLISHRSAARAKGPVQLSEALAGLSFIRRHQIILGAISLDMFAVLLGGVVALLPIVASEILQIGPAGLGVLRSMPALGAVMVGLALAHTPIRGNAGHILFAATGMFGLATIVFGLSESFFLSLGLLWLMGASDVISVVIRQTLVQSETPDEMRGRVGAVYSLFVGASNELGEFESGATAAIFGLVPAIIIGGVGTIAVAALWTRLFPALWRRDQLVEALPS